MTQFRDVEKTEISEKEQHKKWKRVTAQVVASSANCWMFISVGMAFTFVTVEVAALTSGKDDLKLTPNGISWISSICFLFQAIGSLIGGLLIDPLGRKKTIIVVNLPHVAAWIMIWTVSDATTLFFANALMGLGAGLMKAPVTSYLGEICEPSVRGVIVAYSSIFTTIGICCAYLFGAVMQWRTAAAVCLVLPITGIIMVLLIPESPQWLLSRGRKDEALKSLCWLRGWTHPKHVSEEFEEMVKYNDNNSNCKECRTTNESVSSLTKTDSCTHKELTLIQKFVRSCELLLERETLRPLIVASMFLFFTNMTGVNGTNPNIVNVFKAFNVSMDAHWAAVSTGVLSIVGALLCMALVTFTGKRAIVLVCMAGSCIFTFLLAMYAKENIPAGTSTFQFIEVEENTSSSMALFLFLSFKIINYTGIYPIVWSVVCEIFPYKTRGTACGIVCAVYYVLYFITTKTYYDLESSFQIYGALYFYSAVTFVGLIYLYVCLPETENRSSAEIEARFASDEILFADDFVARSIKRLRAKRKEKARELQQIDNDVEGIFYTQSTDYLNKRNI